MADETEKKTDDTAGSTGESSGVGKGQRKRRSRPPRRQYHSPMRPISTPIELGSQIVQDTIVGFRYSEADGEYREVDHLGSVAAACQQLDSRLPTIAGDNPEIQKILRALWSKFDEARQELDEDRSQIETILATAGMDPDHEIQTMVFRGEPYVIEGHYVSPGHRRFVMFLQKLDELMRLVEAAWIEEQISIDRHTELLKKWRKRARDVSMGITSFARKANMARREPQGGEQTDSSQQGKKPEADAEMSSSKEVGDSDGATGEDDKKSVTDAAEEETDGTGETGIGDATTPPSQALEKTAGQAGQ